MSSLPRLAWLAVAVSVTFSTAACRRSPQEPAAGQRTAATPAPTSESQSAPSADPHAGFLPPGHMPMGPMAGHMGGPMGPGAAAASDELVWDDPAGWQRVAPSSPMRRAQYRITAASGETGDGELVVITFGGGQGGDIESNLERWYGQVIQPDGRPTSAVATRQTFTVGELSVTVTEAPGRIGGAGGMAMPGMPAAPTFEHGRLLAAIVQAPHGPWFFKITGPDHTVAAARPAFESMLRSIRVLPSH